jgi:hypothetical protein
LPVPMSDCRVYKTLMLGAQREIEAMVLEHRPFEEIERRIDSLPLADAQRAALWLLAWAEQDARTRRRVATEALAHVADRGPPCPP